MATAGRATTFETKKNINIIDESYPLQKEGI
jgi:hypothetical protein